MKKTEIVALSVTVLFIAFTLGYFFGRHGAMKEVTVELEPPVIETAAETAQPRLPEPSAAVTTTEQISAPPSAAPTAPAAPSALPPASPPTTPSALPPALPPAVPTAAPLPSPPPEVTPEPEPAAEPHYLDGKLRLNLATQAELEALPGIGPVIAERIIAYRGKNGGFKRLTTLKSIEGIGDKKYEAVKDLITVD